MVKAASQSDWTLKWQLPDRPPTTSSTVLVQTPIGVNGIVGYVTAFFDDETWWPAFGWRIPIQVLAWAALPMPNAGAGLRDED